MKKRTISGILIACAFLLSSGCAVLSKELRREAEKDLSFSEILSNPEAHEGKVVIVGGVVVESKNTQDGTLLEVLQKPLDMANEPRDVDQSGGRFLAVYDGYLDTEIYEKGRNVTIGGVVLGKRTKPLGEIQYTYPVIGVRELHLWPEMSRERVYPYSYWDYPYWGYPYWGYPWWYDPFWRPGYFRRW